MRGAFQGLFWYKVYTSKKELLSQRIKRHSSVVIKTHIVIHVCVYFSYAQTPIHRLLKALVMAFLCSHFVVPNHYHQYYSIIWEIFVSIERQCLFTQAVKVFMALKMPSDKNTAVPPHLTETIAVPIICIFQINMSSIIVTHSKTER